MNKKFVPAIERLKSIVDFLGTDYSSYNDKAKNIVAESFQLAKTIKIVLDISLIKEDGTLNDYETKQAIEKVQAALAKL